MQDVILLRLFAFTLLLRFTRKNIVFQIHENNPPGHERIFFSATVSTIDLVSLHEALGVWLKEHHPPPYPLPPGWRYVDGKITPPESTQGTEEDKEQRTAERVDTTLSIVRALEARIVQLEAYAENHAGHKGRLDGQLEAIKDNGKQLGILCKRVDEHEKRLEAQSDFGSDFGMYVDRRLLTLDSAKEDHEKRLDLHRDATASLTLRVTNIETGMKAFDRELTSVMQRNEATRVKLDNYISRVREASK